MVRTSSVKRVRKLIGEQRFRSSAIGLVPTMGAFHEGHLSLIRRARKECDFVAVSIFINPAQFSPDEDYHLYPRDLNRDLKLAAAAGADLVFTPSADDIYPEGYATYIDIGNITDKLEGKIRSNHFRGVATIVAKLFHLFQPDRSYFGQKDAQQLAVINKMARELNFPIRIVPCGTVRDKSGIALSSRHRYLSEAQMKKAVGVYMALSEGTKMIKSGVSDFGRVRRRIIDVLNNYGLKRIDYVSFNRWDTLEPLRKPDGKVLISLAVRMGRTRLIDNVIL